jgi:hypothetical protein
MHLALMVWKDSKHYNTAASLSVLLRQICNDLIARARAFVEPEAIFEIEASEAVERLVATLKVCGFFKACYFTYKLKSAKENPQNQWRVQNSALFPRLDAFNERCMDLLQLFKTVTQLEKLERVEVGGDKGAHLTMAVAQIYADFSQLYRSFTQVAYDVLDVESAQFDADFYAFRQRIQELETRLSNVINDGFDDCASISDAFNLTYSFGDLLERDFIQVRGIRARARASCPHARRAPPRPPHRRELLRAHSHLSAIPLTRTGRPRAALPRAAPHVQHRAADCARTLHARALPLGARPLLRAQRRAALRQHAAGRGRALLGARADRAHRAADGPPRRRAQALCRL